MSFFNPTSPFGDDTPRLGNPAHAVASVNLSGEQWLVVSGVTGTFTLWRDGQLLVDQRVMTQGADKGDNLGILRCSLTAQELSVPGIYQWRMVLKTTVNGQEAVVTEYGDFGL
jgi:hypothetical protein